MSKKIKLTQEDIVALRGDFEEALRTGKFSDGKFTFSKDLGKLENKAKVIFEPLAWCKQNSLISEFNKEVAWHGVAVRGEEPGVFIIKDILVYPQEVTGATVTTDQELYQTWLMSHDDEVFNNIRYQGHSHVNMGTSPSGVDNNLYDSILEQLDDTMFYIFMIWNKRGEKTVKIYDLMENVFYDTTDVTIEIAGMQGFKENAKEMVADRVVTPVTTYQNPNGYGSYVTPSAQTKGREKKADDNSGTKNDQRWGYRNNPKAQSPTTYQQNLRNYYDDYEDEDGYPYWQRRLYS